MLHLERKKLNRHWFSVLRGTRKLKIIYTLTRNLPGVARVITLICKKGNATNFLPSLKYDIWTYIRKGERFRKTILDYVMLNL